MDSEGEDHRRQMRHIIVQSPLLFAAKTSNDLGR